MNKWDEQRYVLYEMFMFYVYSIMCCVQNVKYDDACYFHGITFLIQILKDHKLS